jgi:hypothetical protein
VPVTEVFTSSTSIALIDRDMQGWRRS